MTSDAFERSRILLGDDTLSRLSSANVIIFGVGGVGSWCAEALIRTGLSHLTIVDDDSIVPSNINRQAPATSLTIGLPKVDALRSHLLEINPSASVTALRLRYSPSEPSFSPTFLASFNAIVDAIDSIPEKTHLLQTAATHNLPLFSSMGAALRLNPTLVRTAPFHSVTGDKLAKSIRHHLRTLNPSAPLPSIPCVFSLEPPTPRPSLGSLMPVTATFGLTLASLVLHSLSSPS